MQFLLCRAVCAAFIAIFSTSLYGAEFFVSPSGSGSGTGSISNPWNLATALSHPAAVRPGDTIWLRGGMYRGAFLSSLKGTAAAPIRVRRYQNERVILDSGTIPTSPTVPMYSALTIHGAYTWYWGFEITNTQTTRTFQNSQCWENQHCRGAAVDVFGPGVKIINLVIYDVGNGIGLWSTAVDSEAYGNIIYNAGWQSEVRGSGHGLYAQNASGMKRITDNLVFNGFHSGLHIYGGSDARLDNFQIEGNVIFHTGLLAADPNGWGILVGGTNLAHNITIRNNYLYNPAWFTRSNNLDPSYRSGTTGLTLSNNYSVGHRAVDFSANATNVSASGNSFYGLVMGNITRGLISAATNSIGTTLPAQNRVFLRRNQYEPNKTTIVVFNGTRASQASVDVSSALVAGDTYQVRDVQNYFGQPLVTGTYNGSPIHIPMTSTAVSPTVGTVPRPPQHTAIEFGTFILVKGSGSTTSPTPTSPTPTSPTPTSPTPTSPTPTSPTPSTTPESTTSTETTAQISLEAENGVLRTDMSTTAWDGTGGRIVFTPVPNSGTLDLTFTVPVAGTYAVWARMFATSMNADSFFVSLDGGPEYVFDTNGTWSSSLIWTNLRQRIGTAATVWNLDLSSGTHRLRFRGREPFTGLDRLVITNNLNFRPQ